jgi:hypothetical protein
MNWLHLERELSPELALLSNGAELVAHLGRPGPWRVARSGGGLALVCDLPAGEEGNTLSPALHAWALACAEPRPVPVQAASAATSPAATSRGPSEDVHVAGLHAGGRWIDTAERLALVFDLGPLPAEARRAAWARALCHDAMRRWCWVRLGIDATGALAAEIDLTGAPEELLPTLQGLARASLQRVVAWVLPSLSLLRDPGLELRVLDLHPVT